MAYTDLTGTWAYKSLLTWQALDAAAENDDLFHARFTGDATNGLIPGPLRITNNVFIKWRNNAGGADVDGVKLNTSDQVEIGTTLKNPTLDADPTASLQTATKQYVDAEVMRIGLVARVSASTGSTSFVDVVNISAKAGRLWGTILRATTYSGQARFTIDGTSQGTFTTTGIGTHNAMSWSVLYNDTTAFQITGAATVGLGDLGAFFRTSLRVEHKTSTLGGGMRTELAYEVQA